MKRLSIQSAASTRTSEATSQTSNLLILTQSLLQILCSQLRCLNNLGQAYEAICLYNLPDQPLSSICIRLIVVIAENSLKFQHSALNKNPKTLQVLREFWCRVTVPLDRQWRSRISCGMVKTHPQLRQEAPICLSRTGFSECTLDSGAGVRGQPRLQKTLGKAWCQ